MELEEWTSIFIAKIEELNRPDDSWNLRFSKSIEKDSLSNGWKQYIKSARARFTCSKCKKGWPSNRVAVLFHMRLAEGKGTVKVRPCRQQCRRCTEAPMEAPRFNSENIDILLEKLVEKIRQKCYGEDVGERPRFFHNFEVKGPHEAAHCEGCKLGMCDKDLVGMMSGLNL